MHFKFEGGTTGVKEHQIPPENAHQTSKFTELVATGYDIFNELDFHNYVVKLVN